MSKNVKVVRRASGSEVVEINLRKLKAGRPYYLNWKEEDWMIKKNHKKYIEIYRKTWPEDEPEDIHPCDIAYGGP